MRLPESPRRIVSLVPSTTETVFDLGAGQRLVGVTRYCVHPAPEVETAMVIGGTKSPRIDVIRELEPDLILANQEENRQVDVIALRRFAPVHVAYPTDVTQAIDEIRTLGRLLHCIPRAEVLASEIEQRLHQLLRSTKAKPFHYLYLIWHNPYMAVGPGTFIDAFLQEAGGQNVAPSEQGRYPSMTPEQILASGAEVVFLSSEPFPFTETHAEELRGLGGKSGPRLGPSAWQTQPVVQADGFSLRESLRSPRSRAGGPQPILVDGELLSWHGSRLRLGIPYLAALRDTLHAEC